MDMNRRQFFKVCGVGLGASSMAALGMAPPQAFAETIRHFKLASTRETRNTCPYCSVGCGLIMYSQGDAGKNVKQSIIHIEGDADHPVNRGTLCPKGAGLLDFIHSPNRLKYPEVREAGSGTIVSIASGLGLLPFKRRSAYAASKAGVIAFSKAIAMEWAPEVRVNTIEPGPILFLDEHGDAWRQQVLAKTPLAREGGLEPIWQAVQLLMQNDYMTGASIRVDGGRALAVI